MDGETSPWLVCHPWTSELGGIVRGHNYFLGRHKPSQAESYSIVPWTRAAVGPSTAVLQNAGIIVGSSPETDLAPCLGYDKYSGVFMKQKQRRKFPQGRPHFSFTSKLSLWRMSCSYPSDDVWVCSMCACNSVMYSLCVSTGVSLQNSSTWSLFSSPNRS